MDLVKIGFQINANGLKDANVEVDKLLTKVTRVSSKSINLKVKLDNSIQSVKKTLSDVEKIKNNLSALNIKVSMVGYSQVKANLEKLEALKKNVKDIQIRFTTVGNVNKVKDDLLKLKNKIVTVKVLASTAQLDNLKKKLNSIRDKTVKLNINLPKASDVEKLGKALDKLTNKKVKIEVILTPDLTIIKEYANALDRIRGGRRTTRIDLGGAGGSGGGRQSAGAFDQVLGIAKYALLSAAIYGVITGLKDLAVSFVETADAVTNLTQRLGIYLPANIKVNKVMEQLGDIAKENRTALADSGKLFTQLLPPINRIKGGVAETIAVVDAFGKAMLIGGVNTQEAASATIQFGQAMASGKLAGDEFRSLAEASPRLLQAIADGAGIAAQKLKEMSAAGKLTSGLVSAALLDQFIQLEYEATKMGQTISGAFNEGMVAYQLFINTFNEQTGFTTSIVESIRSVVKSLEGFGKSFLASLKDGDSTLNSFLGLLRTVLDLVGAVVGGFTDVVGWILKAGEKTGLWKATFDSTQLAIITVVDTLAKIPFVIVNIGTRLVELVLKPFEYFIALAQKGLDLAGFDTAAASLGQGLSNYRGVMGDIKGVTGEVVTGFNLLSFGVKETENSTGNVKDILDKLKQQNKDLVIQEQEKKAMTDSQYISEYAKLLLQQEGVDVNAENLNLVKKEIEERFKITQEQAKQLKIAGEAQAKKDEAEAKAKKAAEEAKKAAEQEQKRLQGIRDSYQEQIAYVQRLQMLLGQGEKADVARIAAEKDYVDAIGETSVARQVAEAKRQLSITEYNMSLDEEAGILKEIQKLQDRGATNEQARALAQAKYVADELGMLALEYKLVNELENKKLLLTDQARTQGDINRLLAKGLSIEEAETEAAFARLSFMTNGLSLERQRFKEQILFQQKLLAERQADGKALETMNQLSKESALYVEAQSKSYSELGKNIAIAVKLAQNPDMKPSRAKELVEAESLNAYQKDLANLKYQTYLNTLNESDAVKQLIEKYADADSVQIGIFDRQQKLLAISKELSDEAEKQRNSPIGDFSNVDFSVFGDIGNPFKEALDGLNEFIVRSQDGANILASLNEDIVQSKQKGLDVTNLEAERTLVLAQQEKNRQLALDKGISTTLALTKSMFKEESKGYKIVSGLEKAYQAGKIAFAIWEKKDAAMKLVSEISGYAKSADAFISSTLSKISVEGVLNTIKGVGAIIQQGTGGDVYSAIPRMAAMAAVVAALGVAVSGAVSGSSGSFAPTNEGTGTVFGDKEAKSASIANSIDLLSENSDLMLPLTSAMLASLRNIESSIGGVTNLVIRQATGEGFNIAEGFKQNGIGKGIESTVSTLNKLTFGLADTLSFGLFSAISKALGGLFGSKTTIKGQGLSGKAQSLGDTLSGGFDLQEYADVQVKKKTLGITTSTKNKTQFTEADKELEKQFTLIFGGFYDSILSATNILGANTDEVKTKLENAIINIGKIDLKGLSGEEIQEKLEAVFGAAADSLAQQGFAGLDDFQQVGEGYFETLTRVASSLEQAQYYTDQLNVSAVKYTEVINKQGDITLEIVRQSVLLASTSRDVVGGFDSMVESFSGSASELVSFVEQLRDLQVSLALTGKDSQYLTQTMIQGAGGIQALSEGFSSYYDMLSAQEQATHLTAQMTEKFRELGHELPVSIQGYKDLLNEQEVVTTSGQKLYGQLISLAPEFTELQSALERAEDEANALKKEAEDLSEAQRKAAEEAAKYATTLAKIRQEMFVTKQSGEYLSEAMIKAAGGTDELSKGLQAYFSMLTPAEQATELTRRMTEQFGVLGQTLPSSVDAFRLLIEGLDITTMSGQELYGQLIALAPEFNALQSSVKAAEDAERSRREEASRAAEESARAQREAAEESARAQREAAEAAAKAAEEARELAKKWDELRTMMFVTKQSGENLSQIMINAAGGIDELASGLESYFSLLSDQEQVEELTRRLNIEFSKLGLALPNTVEEFRNLVEGMDTNTNAGKKLYGQVIALTPQFKELQDMMGGTAEAIESLVHLKFAFETTGKDAQYLTTAIAKAAGGVDKLSSGLDAYFDMLSPQEKAIELTRRLTSQFNDIGQTLPSSVGGFRNLISSIDVTTDEGKKLYGQVIALAPEFNTLQDALNSSANEVDDLVKSLRDLADEARKARGGQDNPKNLNITRWQFEQAANKAMLGDVEAAQQLLTLGKDLMEISSAYASSGEDYARDLALIQRAATVAADTQASGLGTSTAPTLSPTTGTNTPPTVSTTNTAMTTELRGMREELNAGLFAIAKFVQNVDSRTERWDDGNRVMVGIQPENGDIPVPVVVTP